MSLAELIQVRAAETNGRRNLSHDESWRSGSSSFFSVAKQRSCAPFTMLFSIFLYMCSLAACVLAPFSIQAYSACSFSTMPDYAAMAGYWTLFAVFDVSLTALSTIFLLRAISRAVKTHKVEQSDPRCGWPGFCLRSIRLHPRDSREDLVDMYFRDDTRGDHHEVQTQAGAPNPADIRSDASSTVAPSFVAGSDAPMFSYRDIHGRDGLPGLQQLDETRSQRSGFKVTSGPPRPGLSRSSSAHEPRQRSRSRSRRPSTSRFTGSSFELQRDEVMAAMAWRPALSKASSATQSAVHLPRPASSRYTRDSGDWHREGDAPPMPALWRPASSSRGLSTKGSNLQLPRPASSRYTRDSFDGRRDELVPPMPWRPGSNGGTMAFYGQRPSFAASRTTQHQQQPQPQQPQMAQRTPETWAQFVEGVERQLSGKNWI